jgi:hypothetical protein
MSARRTVAAAVGAGALLAAVPTAAHADRPGPSLKRSYDRAYAKAEKAGHEPGRNIVEDGVRAKGGARRATEREVRRSLGVLRRMVAAPASGGVATGGSTASAGLQAIAACESGGDPTAVDATGTYRGKYQFDYGTWQAVGGTGDPAAAPEAEQDRRAQMLMAQRGSSPWPVCGG